MKLKKMVILTMSLLTVSVLGACSSGGEKSSSESKAPEKGETVDNPITFEELLAKDDEHRNTMYYVSGKVSYSTGSRSDGRYDLFFESNENKISISVKGASRLVQDKFEANKASLNFADKFSYNDMKGYNVTFSLMKADLSKTVKYGEDTYTCNNRVTELQDFSLTTDAQKPAHTRKAVVYRGDFYDGRPSLYEGVSATPTGYSMRGGSQSNTFSIHFDSGVPSEVVVTTWGLPDEVGDTVEYYVGNTKLTAVIDENHEFVVPGNANISFLKSSAPEIIEMSYDIE